MADAGVHERPHKVVGSKQRPVARHAGRVLADALIAQGIDHVFTVPGESFLDTLEGIRGAGSRIKLVTCRFEAGAVHMAEAYGKLTGHIAAAMVSRGPGACHGAVGVHVAFQDSTPLLLFVGQIDTAHTDREAFQEVDYRAMFRPLAKWVTQIDDPARIPETIAHAVDVATSGRRGPVVISLSEDMQAEFVEVTDIGPSPVAVAHPSPDALVEMMDLLRGAKRPLAILGGSHWSEPARTSVARFLVANGIPVAVSFRRQSIYDGSLPNYVGDLGIGTDPTLLKRVREADLILAIGTRIGDAATQSYSLLDPGGSTPIVHVYPEPSEIGRVFRVALGIVSDLSAFGLALNGLEPIPDPAWREWTATLRREREDGRQAGKSDGPLDVASVMRELDTIAEDDAIFTTDAGNFAVWPARYMHFRQHQDYLGPTNGSMGYAVPAAVGAKIAFPHRMVVAFVGDGGFLMTGQEIATACQYDAPVIVIVFNNGMYGTIRMHQEARFPTRVVGTDLANPDFARLADAYGAHGEKVRTTDEFGPAFRRAVASGKPAVIELVTDPEQITTRTTITALRAKSAAATEARPE
jgi:acetolactate synthase-1/2/3 large subunit